MNRTQSNYLLAVGLVLLVALWIPAIPFPGGTDYQAYRIAFTGSMEPTLTGGDIIITTPVDDVDDISEGDIIVFEDDRGRTVTHRVVDKMNDGVQTKGDAYERKDPWIIPEDRIYGEMTYKIPTGALFPDAA